MQCSQSQHWDLLVNFLHQMMASLPRSNPFKTTRPDSMRLFKFFMTVFRHVGEQLSSILTPIVVDERFFDGAFIVTDFAGEQISLADGHQLDGSMSQEKMKCTQDIALIKKAEKDKDDYGWSILEILISCANYLLGSPFPNFGVLALFNDTCIFDLMGVFADCLGKTSTVSITTRPDLFKSLVQFTVTMCQYFRLVILQNQAYFDFVSRVLLLTFISPEQEVVKNGCLGLRYLIVGDSVLDPIPKSEAVKFHRHFVLSLNVVMQPFACAEASEVVHYFAKIDSGFAFQIGERIKSGLESETLKESFAEAYSHILGDDPGSFNSRAECLQIQLCDLPVLGEYFDINQMR